MLGQVVWIIAASGGDVMEVVWSVFRKRNLTLNVTVSVQLRLRGRGWRWDVGHYKGDIAINRMIGLIDQGLIFGPGNTTR